MRWLREFGEFTNSMGSPGIPAFGKALAWYLYGCLGWTELLDNDSPLTGTGTATHIGGGNIVFNLPQSVLKSALHSGNLITTTGGKTEDQVYNVGITVTARNQCTYFNPNDPLEISPSVGLGYTISSPAYPLNGWRAGVAFSGSGASWNITGGDFQFRDLSGPFDPSFVNKAFIITGGGDRNRGVYRVSSYIDAANITVNFISGSTEYPDQETGLNWAMYLENPEFMFLNNGATYEVASPGANPWRVRLVYDYDHSSFTQTLRMYVSAGSDWSNILTSVSIPLPVNSAGYGYAAGNDDNLSILIHDTVLSLKHAMLSGIMSPIESRSSIEKVYCGGGVSPVRSRDFYSKDTYWDQLTSNLLEPSYGTAANGFSEWTSRQRNSRMSGSLAGESVGDSIAMVGSVATLTDAGATFYDSDVGKKIRVSGCTNGTNNGMFEVTARLSATQIQFTNAVGVNETSAFTWSMDYEDTAIGGLVITDPNNYNGQYGILGRVECFLSSRRLADRFAFSGDEYLDCFHWDDGVSFPWPGVTPQH